MKILSFSNPIKKEKKEKKRKKSKFSGFWSRYMKMKCLLHHVFVWRRLSSICTMTSLVRTALQFGLCFSFLKVEEECNLAELVDLLNFDRICLLEVAWILEDINWIRDSFDFIFNFSFTI